MRTHVKVPPGGTSAPRAERVRPTEAPATMRRIAPAATTARMAPPTHELGRMTSGGRLAAKPDEGREAEAIPNNTGLPDRLKAGIENLSGFAMDDVRVHFNSSKPAALQAFAYTQDSEIHVGPGQQRYLPHEAWHVAQQKQGRVKSTLLMKGKAISGDGALEREADHFGSKADSAVARRLQPPAAGGAGAMRSSVIQRAPFWTINGKPFDLGKLSITELQALRKTTQHSGATQAIDAQIEKLQQAKEVGGNAGGGSNTSAIVKGGTGNDKKDSGGNNKFGEKKQAGGSTSQTAAVATYAAPKFGEEKQAGGSTGQTTALATHTAPKAGQKTVVTNTKPALAGKTGGATAAAPPAQTQADRPTITPQRWRELGADAQQMLRSVAAHYAKYPTGETNRTVDSGIKTKMHERKAIKTYLKLYFENEDVPDSKDLKFYIVAPRLGDKLDITGHRFSQGKDKSLGGKNLFNYHVKWKS